MSDLKIALLLFVLIVVGVIATAGILWTLWLKKRYEAKPVKINNARISKMERLIPWFKEIYSTCQKNLMELKMRTEPDLFKRIEVYLKIVDIKSMEDDLAKIKNSPNFEDWLNDIGLVGEVESLEKRIEKTDEVLSQTRRNLEKIIETKDEVFERAEQIRGDLDDIDLLIEKSGDELPEAYKRLAKEKREEFDAIDKEILNSKTKINWFVYSIKLTVLRDEICLIKERPKKN